MAARECDVSHSLLAILQKNMLKKLKKEKKQYWGDLTGVRGDLDECQITGEDRKNGIDIEDLINN